MSGHTTFIKKCFDEKELYRRENEKLRKGNEILRDALIDIAKMDLSDEVDSLWLSKWRNDTKEKSDVALKEYAELVGDLNA